MRMKKTIFTAALAAFLAAAAPSFSSAPVFGTAVCEAMVPYQNEGLTLLVPNYYDDLLSTKIFKEDEEGRLFSVTEAKSVVDSWLQGNRESGPGWLFTIRRVNEEKLQELLCSDMSGAEVFAKDSKGRHYIFMRPTDVRFVRKDSDTMQRDSQLWQDLCEWAGKDGNYFRQVTDDGGETLFHAKIDGDESAVELVSRWCRQLTQSGGSSASAVTSDFVGRWAETNAHRGTITVTQNGGEYDVEIDWANGAAEHDIWRMTATPSGADRFSYSDGEYSVQKYRPDGNYNETVRSTGLTGTFILHGPETLVWSDDEQGRDSVFVRT